MYKDTADFYDLLTSDIDYSKYVDFFSAVFLKHSKTEVHNVLDLGCGTGVLTIAMADKGYDMTGLDASPDMLSVAYGKKCPGVLWINQDFTELDLFGAYDAAISLLDCINHLLKEEMVEKYIKHMYNFVEPNGLFIFDINSEYKFKNTYKNNVFYSVADDFTYIWENKFDEKTGMCEMDLTFFLKEGNLYNRYDSVNKEKYYSVDFLRKTLERSGFSIEALYDDCSFNLPVSDTERIFFVCRRMG